MANENSTRAIRKFTFPLSMVCADVVPDGGQVVSLSITIEFWVDHSVVDGSLDAPCGPIIFPVSTLTVSMGQE